MQGMALAIEHSNAPVILQSDSSEVLSCLATEALQRSAYGQLVLDIKYLSGIREFIPQKLSRVQNRVADCLANYSRTKRATAVWLGSIPPCIEDVWPLDCNSMNLQ
ncbi:hypothetical protein VPH35_116231 [Triticum aestivum]